MSQYKISKITKQTKGLGTGRTITVNDKQFTVYGKFADEIISEYQKEGDSRDQKIHDLESQLAEKNKYESLIKDKAAKREAGIKANHKRIVANLDDMVEKGRQVNARIQDSFSQSIKEQSLKHTKEIECLQNSITDYQDSQEHLVQNMRKLKKFQIILQGFTFLTGMVAGIVASNSFPFL